MARRVVFDDPALGALTRDRLTRDYAVYQRAEGHRFSVDDVATAWVACNATTAPSRILDLGCGLGSVLLHLAWKFPEASLVGIEAQAMSFELVRRNVTENGLAGRIALVHGDLREAVVLDAAGGGFDLVTGTPPYFPPDAATGAEDEQRAFARIEYRGGVEAYIEAADRTLAPSGRFVLCGASEADHRVCGAAEKHGFHVIARADVVPREGRSSLFAIWTLARTGAPLARTEITIRDRAGQRTEAARALTRFSGLVPKE
ncbi:MAG: methyltransferase domain-containing protein [Deltaproteobacteria bacterium]